MEYRKLRLSVLDQSPINKNETAVEALLNTTNLAIETEKLGYTRFWVSEHHNMDTLAGSSPEILTAHLASHTKTMRIGSGGVMLPNHSALKMAENFRLLEALYPNRIDMGIGRAPGTDRMTASVLNPSNTFDPQDFLQQLSDLENFLLDSNERGTIYNRVKARPKTDSLPHLWLLTSSGESGMIAARYGLALSYAQFINPRISPDVVKMYRDNFVPSPFYKMPQVNVAIFAFCNENEEVVRQHQAVMDYRFIQLERDGILAPVRYDEIKHVRYSDFEQQRIKINKNRYIFGTPDDVKQRISELANLYGIDEIMLITYSDNFEYRVHSYKLLADMFIHES